jgi:DNA-binding transcriptional LysR family regulator
LSQQLQRLERELGVGLLDRSTHHVALTPAGSAFLVEARQILVHLDRAAATARRAAVAAPTLRVGIVDASYDVIPQMLCAIQAEHPDLEIHQVEVGVPEQYQLLAQGRLDVGIGGASLAPAGVASELFRLDPLGVLVSEGHRFAGWEAVPVKALARESLLLDEQDRAPEFNQFVVDLCRSAGFAPTLYRGTVQSIRAAVDLLAQQRCVLCVPSSCRVGLPGIRWVRLVAPSSCYPWSVLWRAGDDADLVRAVVVSARLLARQQGWLEPPELAAG